MIHIRQSKLPDPKQYPNAGSFFKNPVISQSEFDQIAQQFPNLPHYPQANQQVKIAAGWLIDQAGWKGRDLGPVGMYEKQALVLVNHGAASGGDVHALMQAVQRTVLERFGIADGSAAQVTRLLTETTDASTITVFDAAAAFICGFVLQVFLNAIDSRTASKFIINLASSAVVAVCAVLLFTVGLGDSLDKIIIGSIIRLVPGVALTTSIRDFLNGDYLSGTIRIIDAFLVGGCIAIGVGAVVMTYISLTGGAPLL